MFDALCLVLVVVAEYGHREAEQPDGEVRYLESQEPVPSKIAVNNFQSLRGAVQGNFCLTSLGLAEQAHGSHPRRDHHHIYLSAVVLPS